MEMLCALLYIYFIYFKIVCIFLAGPGVCVDDNGNERKVSTVC